MAKEMQIIAGKHKCGKDMDMRIVDVREDENDKDSKVIAWMIYGICKPCNIVLMSSLFTQEEKPITMVDYVVDYTIIADEVPRDEAPSFAS